MILEKLDIHLQKEKKRNLDLYHINKLMATHSSILAWRIPWTEEPESRTWLRRLSTHAKNELYT